MSFPSSAATAPDEARLEQRAPAQASGFVNRFGVAALIAVAPASILFLSFNRGGYFPNSTGLAAIGFAAALVLRTTLAERPFDGYSRPLAVLLMALGFFALWQLLSGLWAHDPARTLDQYDRTLLYLLAFALFGSLPRSSLRLRWLIRAVAAGMTAVCLAALISRVLPHVLPTAAGSYARRLNYPLSYWNADGLLAALATLLLIHLASSDDEHPAGRVLAAIFVPATAATLLLTFSRGSMIVGVIGLVVYVLVGQPRAILGAAVAIVPTSVVAVHAAYAAELLASDRLVSPAAVAQGHHVAKVVAICMVAAAVIRSVMLVPDALAARALSDRRATRMLTRGIPILAAAAVVIAFLVLLATGFIAREWNQFARTGTSSAAATRERLGSINGSGRVDLWRLALHAFDARPLLGSGAGTYELYYARHRGTSGFNTDAHQLYLQTLAELGIVGFLALGIVVFGVLVLLARRIRGPDRTACAVLFATSLMWAIHAAVDWDWQMPAVTLLFFIGAGLALATPRSAVTATRSGPRNRTALAVGWLALAVAPLLIGVSYARLRVSRDAFIAGDCTAARQSAFSSIALEPIRPQAYQILSFCDLQMGFPVEGLQAARKAVHYAPDDWNYRYGLAIALAENGLNPRRAAAQALSLNPREPLVQDEAATFAHGGRSDWQQAAEGLLIGALQTERLAISNI